MRYPRAPAADSASAIHSAARPQNAWPRLRTGSSPGKDRSGIPVPETSRIRRTVSETLAPASTDKDTGTSHSFSPAENTISVTVPSGTVFRHTSETVPAARTESSARTAISFAAQSR